MHNVIAMRMSPAAASALTVIDSVWFMQEIKNGNIEKVEDGTCFQAREFSEGFQL